MMSVTTEPASQTEPSQRIMVGSLVSLLAVVPHLLGFVPETSLVAIGADAPHGQILLTLRYDLPDPPDQQSADDIAAHATEVLAAQRASAAMVVGYGPDVLVAPIADALRRAAAVTGLCIAELLRVEGQRYWSYLCDKEECCPPGGIGFDPATQQAIPTTGSQVLASREDLAASIAAVSGEAAETMRRATRRAEDRAARLISQASRDGSAARVRRELAAVGIQSVIDAISVYRRSGTITDHHLLARLTVSLRDLRVRDDAWARMDPEWRESHRRLWTDLTRYARPGYVAAPASLLAFAAWQGGNGALANVALDRALTDQPGYSMAQLLRQAIGSGVPPSAARLPMTPEQVAASYDQTDDDRDDELAADRRADKTPAG